MDDKNVADTLYNMAFLYRKLNKKSEVVDSFARCVKIYSKIFGPEHSETLDAQRMLERAVLTGSDSAEGGGSSQLSFEM